MNDGQTVFSQLMEQLPSRDFRRCVRRYRGDHRARRLSCLDQFLGMAFAQLTFRESLRDIEACLRSAPTKLYHMGFRGRIARNTLAVANQKRDWRIYGDFALGLIATAQTLYADEPWGLLLKRAVYALDSTTIDLCLALFPWAKFRKKKGGIKVHTLLNVRTHIPAFVCVTPALVHDVNILDEITVEPGAIYVMDRAYLDYSRLYRVKTCGAFFVTRPKKNSQFARVYSRPINKAAGIRSDHTVRLSSFYPTKDYPDQLRRIRFLDPETKKKLSFLTNNFEWAATTIAAIYKSRWQIELFFKWIKQHLRIKAFYGTSENAVKTQIWISISVYVLVALFKRRLNLPQSLYEILQVLSVTLFEKIPVQQLFARTDVPENAGDSSNQLLLFDF
jgi:hypothetical protein